MNEVAIEYIYKVKHFEEMYSSYERQHINIVYKSNYYLFLFYFLYFIRQVFLSSTKIIQVTKSRVRKFVK